MITVFEVISILLLNFIHKKFIYLVYMPTKKHARISHKKTLKQKDIYTDSDFYLPIKPFEYAMLKV